MAILDLNLGNRDQVVNSENADQTGNVININGLGSHSLTVDGVDATISSIANATVGSRPEFKATNGGSLHVNPSALNVSGLNSTTYVVDGASSIDVTQGGVGLSLLDNSNVQFTGEGGGYFNLNREGANLNLGSHSMNVTGMQAGDQLGYNSEKPSFTYSNGTGSFAYKNRLGITHMQYNVSMDDNMGQYIQDNFDDLYQDGTFTMPVCFLRGTKILTPSGEVAIEELQEGDQVLGASGVRTIKWIGRRADWVNMLAPEARPKHLPICISAGALSDNVPTRDLRVSPWHHLLIDGLLIKAGDLVNGSTIYQVTDIRRLEYFHLELDQFDVISAHGVLSESWADGGNRDYFQNADVTQLRPSDKKRRRAPRPGYDDAVRHKGPEVKALQKRFAERAEVMLENSAVVNG